MEFSLGRHRTSVRKVPLHLLRVADETGTKLRQRHRDLAKSELVLAQEKHTKGKVHSMRAPEVECIAKGKAHRP